MRTVLVLSFAGALDRTRKDGQRARTPRLGAAAVVLTTIGLLLSTGGASATTHRTTAQAGGTVIRVVAAENFWGSIASQIGGMHAHVVSIIMNPAQDPHSYEPTASDARTMATAQFAIVNGIGYDWAPKLLAATWCGSC